VASENDRAAVRRSGFGPPRPAEVLFHKGRSFLPSLPPTPEGNGEIKFSVLPATLQVLVTILGVI
jgi:hypothetical protein